MQQELKPTGSRVRVHLESLGCAKNLIDSERILARLATAGAIVGAPPEEAEVIIINTCGFIEPAKKESIDTILAVARYKQEGRCRRLIVMGCLAQRYEDELRRGFPEVDDVFGLGQEEAIVSSCGLASTYDSDRRHDCGRGHDCGRFLLTPPHMAFLRISEGCDNHCTYCTIPSIRGPYRSRPAGEILAEAEGLVDGGVRELVVIAQDTTVYGSDVPGGMPIHDLLARLAEIKKLRWLRLLYTHPAHFPPELIDAYAEIDKLCAYVDLPLQHLDDDILCRMGRNVTQAQSLGLIERLRSRTPEIAVRTTFIVGFPGETDVQFSTLLDHAKRLRFEHVGVFPYSREEDTAAGRMPNQVSERVKEERVRDLMLAQQEIVFRRNSSLVGTMMEVVIDEATEEDDLWIARSSAQAPDVDTVTYVCGHGLAPGRFLRVEVTGVDGYDLIAEPGPSGG